MATSVSTYKIDKRSDARARKRRSRGLVGPIFAASAAVPAAFATTASTVRASSSCSNSSHHHLTSKHYVKSAWPYSSEWKWHWRYYNKIGGFWGDQGTVICGTYPPVPCPCDDWWGKV